MLSAALLRFPHGERSGKIEPPGWGLCPTAPSQALSWSPLPGPGRCYSCSGSLALPITFAVGLPLLVLGLWVHPPFPAGSIPAADCWLAGPGQEASSLCSPQAEWHHPGVSPGVLQLCSLNLIPTSSLPPQMWYRPKYCPLCMGRGLLHHPPRHPQPSAESLPTHCSWATPDLIPCPANGLPTPALPA